MAEAQKTLDQEEIARFAARASEWWDPNGPFKPLHRINPVRLTYIRDQLAHKFGRWQGSGLRSPASTPRQRISRRPRPMPKARGSRSPIGPRRQRLLPYQGPSSMPCCCSK
jgi:2-polyprenyl-3-methyl-5-hydroxy-6-metoxy-1,4-benzoquinol methylase